jgi:hypothetical protein
MIVVLLAGCPRPSPSTPEPRPDAPVVGEPVLEIDAPARGTFVEDGSVLVRGRVRDEGPVRITINGAQAAVGSDGSFTATVQLPRGLAILETHALDADHHDVRDVRAVLAGPFAPSDGSIAAPIGARVGRTGVAALGRALGVSAKAIDFKQAAAALNPIYEDPGCLGARVDIANVTVGAIEVALVPTTNALELAVRVDNIEVKLDVHYRAACIGGSTSMTVRTRARVTSELRVTAGGGRIRTAFPEPDVTLDDFQIQLAGLPGVVESMLKRVTRPAVEIALAQLISSKLPPLVDAQLSALLTRPALPQVLGREVDVIATPSWIELAPTGIAMVADVKLAVRGGAAGRYATTRSMVPVPAGEAAVWVSANSVNQLFAGLWASRAFDRTLPRDQLGPLAMLLDERIATLELAIALPPTIHAEAALQLVVGDLLITARDAAGAEVQRFAVSLRTGLVIKHGQALGTTEPQVFAQLLAQHGPLARPLDPAGVEAIVKGAWSLTATSIDDALAQIPIPGAAKGAQLESLGAREGAIVLQLKMN